MNQPLFAPWVSGQITSPSGMDRTRSVAEALASKYQGRRPQTPWQGLDAVTAALVSRQLDDRADSYEAEQRAAFSDSFGGLFADGADPGIAELANMAGDPFAGPGQQSVINALLAQRMMPEPGPDYSFMNIDGELIRTDATGGGAESLGQYGTPEPGFTFLSPEQAAQMGLDPEKAYQQGPDNRIYEVGGSGVTVNNNMGGGELFDELDKASGQMFAQLANDGVAAGATLVKIDQLDRLLSQIDTGAGAQFQQIAGNFGIQSEGLDNIQAAQAIINQLVPQQRPAGSGPMSDADLELFKQSMPRIINQPGGNRLILDTMRGIARYTQQQGEIAGRLANREITAAQARAELAALPNPLENFGEVAAPQPDQAQNISSQAEYDALPSGTTYIAPDGTTRRKP